jgi:hypothetical protein
MKFFFKSLIFSALVISAITSTNATNKSLKCWKKCGSFLKPLTPHRFIDCYHNRSYQLTPKYHSKVAKITVHGYENNNMSLSISLKKPDNNIENYLTKNKFGKVDNYFNYKYKNTSNKSIPGYLDIFVKNDFIGKDVANHILKVISIAINEELKIKLYEKKKKKNINKILNLIKKTNEIGQKFTDFKMNPKNTFSISEHHFGYTSPYSKYPILATYGSGPSVILALYNKETKKACLANILLLKNVDDSISQIIKNLSNGKNESLVAHIYGGNTFFMGMIFDVINRLKNQKIKIKSANVMANTKYQLAIDSRTGNISNTFHPVNVKEEVKRSGLQFQESDINEQKIPN